MKCFLILYVGVPSLYVFKKKAVFELMKFEDDGYRSWFIDETVQKGTFDI